MMASPQVRCLQPKKKLSLTSAEWPEAYIPSHMMSPYGLHVLCIPFTSEATQWFTWRCGGHQKPYGPKMLFLNSLQPAAWAFSSTNKYSILA